MGDLDVSNLVPVTTFKMVLAFINKSKTLLAKKIGTKI